MVDTNGEQPVSNMISSVSKVIVLCCALMTQFLFLIIFTGFVQSLEFLKKVLKFANQSEKSPKNNNPVWET